MVKPNDGGQLQTVEAITAAIILLSIIALVVDATSVTPLTSSFTNQHVKLELQNIGTDILTAMDETPATTTPTNDVMYPSQLKKSTTDWLNSTGGYDWFACTNTDQYQSLLDPQHNMPINTILSRILSLALLKKSGIAYNVDIRYSDEENNIKNTKMIWNGDPSDNSVTVSRIIALHDCDIGIIDCVVPDVSTTDLYNVLEVRLTMWVM